MEETAEQAIFVCLRFAALAYLNIGNVVGEMCRYERFWNAVNSAITQILSDLQRKWRAEQSQYSNRSLLK